MRIPSIPLEMKFSTVVDAGKKQYEKTTIAAILVPATQNIAILAIGANVIIYARTRRATYNMLAIADMDSVALAVPIDPSPSRNHGLCHLFPMIFLLVQPAIIQIYIYTHI
ncbi:hypothetical protein F4680DRAFT_435296 [Xylaria scruposa]|nr:hypothetical protein F4680DRAFT_435296 [Xylaria scruposa]